MRPPKSLPKGSHRDAESTRIRAATRAVRMPSFSSAWVPTVAPVVRRLVVAIGGAAGVTAIVNAINQPQPSSSRAGFPHPDHRCDVHRWPMGRIAVRRDGRSDVSSTSSHADACLRLPRHVEDYSLSRIPHRVAMLSNALSREHARAWCLRLPNAARVPSLANEIIARSALVSRRP